MEKSVTKALFFRIGGIFLFLIVLGLLNFLTNYIKFNWFVSAIGFFNRNALFLIGAVVLLFFAEILSSSDFPSNIFGPLLNFLASWMILEFVFEFFIGLNKRFNLGFVDIIILLEKPISITILSLVLVFGYLPLFYKLLKFQGSKKDPQDVNIPKPIIIEEVISKGKKPKTSSKKNKSKKKKE